MQTKTILALLSLWLPLATPLPRILHSYKQSESDSVLASTSCSVRLVRRTSKSTACLPDGDTRSGGRFSCADNATVTVSHHCAGLFMCGNGYTTMCPKTGSNTCKCEMPCHANWYLSTDRAAKGQACTPTMPPSPGIPPLPPVPPLPPPPPLAPPPLTAGGNSGPAENAGCEPWCSKRDESKARICKCAACSSEASPLAMGAPCHHSEHHGGGIASANGGGGVAAETTSDAVVVAQFAAVAEAA